MKYTVDRVGSGCAGYEETEAVKWKEIIHMGSYRNHRLVSYIHELGRIHRSKFKFAGTTTLLGLE